MEDIKLAGKTIIPLGTPAYGEVTKVDQKGMFGKSGKVGTRLLAIKFNDQEIRITGTLDGAGAGGTAATIGAVAVIPVAGFFVTGKSALLSPGLQTNGFLESDLVVK
jgi:predicted phage tail protein